VGAAGGVGLLGDRGEQTGGAGGIVDLVGDLFEGLGGGPAYGEIERVGRGVRGGGGGGGARGAGVASGVVSGSAVMIRVLS